MELLVIQQRIYEVRGQKVMLDFDLARLYEVETRIFNQAVKRNAESFPEDFMFRLTAEEWHSVLAMSSQIVMTSAKYRRAGHIPLAFTEHGVTMLASVLKSDKARKMNIAIVRAFIALRKYVLTHEEILGELAVLRKKISNHDVQLSQIYDAIERLLDEKAEQKAWSEREPIGFKKASK